MLRTQVGHVYTPPPPHTHTHTCMHTHTHTHTHTHARTHARMHAHIHTHTHVHAHRELGDSATVFQCHADLGSLNLLDRKPALALRCLREALALWTEDLLWQQKAEVLREMAQVCVWREGWMIVPSIAV